jgi:hypothetical protein
MIATLLIPANIPKLTGQVDYLAWKLNLTSAFLILDLSSTINPRSPPLTAPPHSTPDPLPCLNTMPEGLRVSNTLPEAERQALNLLVGRKRNWERVREAEERGREKWREEEKRKDNMALGWMFLTMEPTLAQEVLLLCSTKHWSDGSTRKAELRELDARTVWEKLRVKYGG